MQRCCVHQEPISTRHQVEEHAAATDSTLLLLTAGCCYSQHHVFARVVVGDEEQRLVGDVGVTDKALHGGVCGHVKDTTKQLQVRLQQQQKGCIVNIDATNGITGGRPTQQ